MRELGRAGSLTGVACIARSRTSRQDMPSLSSAGMPMQDRGRDLDRLEDHAVGDAVAMPTCQPACSTAAHAAWKTPRFAGVAGSTAVMLTANSTAAAAPIPAWLIEAEREQQQVAGQALKRPRRQLRRGSDGSEASAGGTRQAGAHTRQCAAHLGRHRVHARRGASRSAPSRSTTGASSTKISSTSGAIAADQERVLVAVEDVDGREHDRAEDDQRDDVEQRLRDERAEHDRQVLARVTGSARDDKRSGGLAEASRQRRGHQHADERALSGVGQPDAGAGQRGLQDRVPRERAHHHRAAHESRDRAARTSGSR